MHATLAILLLLLAISPSAATESCGNPPEIGDRALKLKLESVAQRMIAAGSAQHLEELITTAGSARIPQFQKELDALLATYPNVAKKDADSYLTHVLCTLARRESRPRSAGFAPVTPGKDAPLTDLFPWPPPTPSTRRSFSPDVVTGSAPARNAGDVASGLEAALKNAEFDSWGYYRAPGGFALVTRIERMDERSGRPLSGPARWSTQLAYGGLRFSSIFAVRRPRGHYRILVFILTNDPPMTRTMDAAAAFDIAKRWAMEGRSSLPAAVRDETVGKDHELVLLIYEFEQVQDGKTTIFTPSRWPADLHVESLGLQFKSRQ